MIKKINKIFIVDDDEMQTSALEEYITRKIPHQVFKFETGEAYIKALFREPDIIILAYYLNNVSKEAANGMEILQSIKEILPQVHVIMLSSQDKYGIALQTIQKGAEQYVMKDENAFEEIERIINEI
jgi:DNA-binding NarL/FixJ family response regulator